MTTPWRSQINQAIVEPTAIRGLPNGQFSDTVLVEVRNGDGVRIGRLCAMAARAWTAMVAAARADGVVLDATDTYRTLQVQQQIFTDRYRTTDQGNGSRVCGGKRWYLRPGKATAACPGTSNHGRGLAVDNRFHGPGLAWLEQHARTFGWAWEVASEDWHIHYLRGDQLPQAVLDYEAHHGTPIPHPSEEDDMRLIVPTGTNVPHDEEGRNHLVGGRNGIVQFIDTRQYEGLTHTSADKPGPALQQEFVDDLTWDVIKAGYGPVLNKVPAKA